MGILSKTRLALTILALLVVAACLVSEPEVYPSRFNHNLHVSDEGMECSFCHVSAESGDKAGMPRRSGCELCHEEDEDTPEDERVLESLFDEDERWIGGPRRAELADELIFSHQAHAGEDCSTCHGPIAESEGIPAPHIGKDDCMSCHSERGASNDCSTCHTYIRKEWVPPTHEMGWQEGHGFVVRAEDEALINRCTLCHDEQASCKACHMEVLPRDHTNFWRQQGHGVMTSIDRSRCWTCHRTDFCDRCHQSTQPVSHQAGWGDPTNRHCYGCHFPITDTSCITCHKGAPSHQNAAPMPDWHNPAMTCRVCHGGGTAPMPHPDPGHDCTICHR